MLLLNFLNVLPPFKSWKLSSECGFLPSLGKQAYLGPVVNGQLVLRGS